MAAYKTIYELHEIHETANFASFDLNFYTRAHAEEEYVEQCKGRIDPDEL